MKLIPLLHIDFKIHPSKPFTANLLYYKAEEIQFSNWTEMKIIFFSRSFILPHSIFSQ